MSEEPFSPPVAAPKQSRIISRVLSPAVRLWIRSQLEQVEDLQFEITAGDRQLLSGSIAQVAVAASKAVYRGIHLSQVSLVAREIQTNLRQVLRGQALRLQAPFAIIGDVRLLEADLNASVRSPLLASGIAEFLQILLKAGLLDEVLPATIAEFGETQIRLQPQRLTLATSFKDEQQSTRAIVLQTGFRVEQGNQLQLQYPQRLPDFAAEHGTPLPHLEGYTFYLGSEVYLDDLKLEWGQIVCRGQVNVTPE